MITMGFRCFRLFLAFLEHVFFEDVLLLTACSQEIGFSRLSIPPLKTKAADSHGRILGSGLGTRRQARTCLWTALANQEAYCACCGLC